MLNCPNVKCEWHGSLNRFRAARTVDGGYVCGLCRTQAVDVDEQQEPTDAELGDDAREVIDSGRVERHG